MKHLLFIAFILTSLLSRTIAQQNWAAVPCSKMAKLAAVNRMWLDSLHNEIVLFSYDGYSVCNTSYKGLVAYNPGGFHSLDKGVNTHDPNLTLGSFPVSDCITYGNSTLFGGYFKSLGTNTLLAKSLALWNGAVWDTFPTHCFPNQLNDRGGSVLGFLKYNGKLWMYGGFDTIGNIVAKNLVSLNGNILTPHPAIPVSNNSPITKMIAYQDKLIATGNFYDYSSFNFFRLAQYNGTSWTQVGNGVRGSLSAAHDLAVYKDTLYIAGAFLKSDGNAGNYIMKWDGNQLSDAGFGNFCGYGAIWKLLTFKNRLYAFGAFSCAAGQKAFGVAYYENGTWTVPQDSIHNWAITSAVVYNDAIYIGGGFKSINGDTSIQNFAKLVCPDFDASAGCVSGLKESSNKLDVKVFPNPLKDKLHLEFEQNTVIDKVSILNTLGQEVYKLLKPAPKQEIDVSYLPLGIYFIKVENKQGQGVAKLVKE